LSDVLSKGNDALIQLFIDTFVDCTEKFQRTRGNNPSNAETEIGELKPQTMVALISDPPSFVQKILPVIVQHECLAFLDAIKKIDETWLECDTASSDSKPGQNKNSTVMSLAISTYKLKVLEWWMTNMPIPTAFPDSSPTPLHYACLFFEYAKPNRDLALVIRTLMRSSNFGMWLMIPGASTKKPLTVLYKLDSDLKALHEQQNKTTEQSKDNDQKADAPSHAAHISLGIFPVIVRRRQVAKTEIEEQKTDTNANGTAMQPLI
jgi:hypothetical protein